MENALGMVCRIQALLLHETRINGVERADIYQSLGFEGNATTVNFHHGRHCTFFAAKAPVLLGGKSHFVRFARCIVVDFICYFILAVVFLLVFLPALLVPYFVAFFSLFILFICFRYLVDDETFFKVHFGSRLSSKHKVPPSATQQVQRQHQVKHLHAMRGWSKKAVGGGGNREGGALNS